MATLAPQHLPDSDPNSRASFDNTKHTITVFNINTEQWEKYSVNSVIDVEQLTGEGAPNNETKLQASLEYLEQFSLFSDDDLDIMEHPEYL